MYIEAVPTINEAELNLFIEALPPRANLCVVVPAYNEEKVIEASLLALKKVIAIEHIFVVSDGSSDHTAELARRHVPNVLELSENVGKAGALNRLIQHFNLISHYEYILFSDADSQLNPRFLDIIRPYMKKKPACIVGTVTSERYGLISAYRTYEYALTNRIFKRAQNIMGVVTVAPGCASAYRSDALHFLEFGNHTLTEDFDLTLQLHEKELGKVLYVPAATVLTQDPPTIGDYWKQVTRWYTGFWQNIQLHKLYQPRSHVNLEIWLLVFDGLGWIFAIVAALLHPVSFLYLLVISDLITMVLALALLITEKAFWAIKYMPLFFIFQFINLAAYVYSFFRAFSNVAKGRLSWHKVDSYSKVLAV